MASMSFAHVLDDATLISNDVSCSCHICHAANSVYYVGVCSVCLIQPFEKKDHDRFDWFEDTLESSDFSSSDESSDEVPTPLASTPTDHSWISTMPSSARVSSPPTAPYSPQSPPPLSPIQAVPSRNVVYSPGSPMSSLPYRVNKLNNSGNASPSRPSATVDNEDSLGLDFPVFSHGSLLTDGLGLPAFPEGYGHYTHSPLTSPTVAHRTVGGSTSATAVTAMTNASIRGSRSSTPHRQSHTSVPASPSVAHNPYYPRPAFANGSNTRSGSLSRESSLPSLMSYPVSRADSPGGDGSRNVSDRDRGAGGGHSPGPFGPRKRESSRHSTLAPGALGGHWDVAALEEATDHEETNAGAYHNFGAFSSRFPTFSSQRDIDGSRTSSINSNWLPFMNTPVTHSQGITPSPSSKGDARHRRRPSVAHFFGAEHYTRVRDDHEGRGMSRLPSPSMSPAPGISRELPTEFKCRRESFGQLRTESRALEMLDYQDATDADDEDAEGTSSKPRPASGSLASRRASGSRDNHMSSPAILPGPWPMSSPRLSDNGLPLKDNRRSAGSSHHRISANSFAIDDGSSLMGDEIKEESEPEDDTRTNGLPPIEETRLSGDTEHGGDMTLKSPPDFDFNFEDDESGLPAQLLSPEEPFLDSTLNGLPPSQEEDDLNVRPFNAGDRLAVGRQHGTELVRDFKEFEEAQKAEREQEESAGEGMEVEVGRVLGTGTYAVVYHAREIRIKPNGHCAYGSEFALKCLSKANLTDDMLQVQRAEVTLHKGLPLHPNIVPMRRAYETDSWLFLLMDYCPGQDLFYWLHERAMAAANPQSSSEEDGLPQQLTPPSPSLLSSTVQTELLSSRRLRLISRMFVQMCSAVAACHEHGISHRDIKPENFIVTGDFDDRVVVKLTDWGLGTMEEMCGDFDTGSKPYMAYECHNNIMPFYDPKKADVWSLGICFINMLFHRSPWLEPSPHDPDFSVFSQAPVSFLLERFEGMTRTVANYLADKVFCDVLDEGCERATAHEFGNWVARLVHHMGGGTKRGSYSVNTIPLEQTVSRPSIALDPQLSQIFQRPFFAANHILPVVGEEEIEKPRRPRFPKKDLLSNAHDYGDIISATAFPDLLPPPQEQDESDEHMMETLDSPALSPTFPERSSRFTLNADISTISLPEGDGNSKPRRRKRGRGSRRRMYSGDADSDVPPLPSPLSGIGDKDEVLVGMAAHTQDLAREISKATNGPTPPLSGRPSTEEQPSIEELPAQKKSSWTERVRKMVKDGNPELQAFKASVQERDREIGATSAPAKMQKGSKKTESGVSSLGSAGTASWGSWSGTEESTTRGRPTGSHWASASNRRARLDQRKRGDDFSPASSIRYNPSTTTLSSLAAFSRPSHSPLSSFSSVNSMEVCQPAPPPPGKNSRAPRQPSPLHPRQGAPNQRHANGTPEEKALSRAAMGSKLDTIAEKTPSGPRQGKSLEPLSEHAAKQSNGIYASRDAATSTTSLRSLNKPASKRGRPGSSSSSATQETARPNMLARMLESIKGANRNYEKGAPKSP